MEEVLCKASTTDVQSVVLNLSIDKEVCLDTTALIPSQHFVNEVEGNVDLPQEALLGVNGHGENGTRTPTLSETLSAPDSMLQKNSSPTLIESAIKAMKNLFSPEKVKNKPSSVLSPINKQRSASGSPSNSIYIPGKSDIPGNILSSEPGKEILNHVQIPVTENNLKIHLPPELGGIPSPVNFENHNNTDESFLTTVSLIDDSFHSAVTHIDENAEMLKNGGNILDCVLNNSQSLDSDNSHDTLENESYLDNTTLKIGNLSFQSENTENPKGTLDNNSEKVGKIYSDEKESKSGEENVEHQSQASNGEGKRNFSETDLLIEVYGEENASDQHLGKAISTTTVILEKFGEKISEEPSTVRRPSLQEKKCASERNSPNCKPNASKIKLNKSDETLNRQALSEGKREINKISVDTSWKKCSEASEVSTQPGVNQTFVNLQPDSPLNNPDPVPVISQQSYTILNHDNKLKRPVIDDNSEKQSFQEEKVSTECSKNLERNSENTSFNGEDLIKSSQLKQSTPLWEGNNDSVQKFFTPTALKLYPLEMENSSVGEELEQALSHSTTGTFSLENGPMEISPVDSINDVKCLYMNKLSSSGISSEKESLTFGTDSRSVISSVVGLDLKSEGDLKNVEDGSNSHQYGHSLNITFDKKEHQAHMQINAASPNNQRDQTFDKSTVSGKNSTFTKKRESGGMENQTFEISASSELGPLNETYAKPQLNETYDKNCDLATHVLDKTSEMIASNQTFTKEADQGNIQESKPVNSIGDGKKNRNTESRRSSVCGSNDLAISGMSSCASVLSPLQVNEFESNDIENMDDFSKMSLNGNFELSPAQDVKLNVSDSTLSDVISVDSQAEEKLLNSLKNEKLRCDPDLVQLIQEQFSQNDIEKICSVVQDMPSLKLTKDILRASEQFDKSFHGNLSDVEFKPPEIALKPENPIDPLSPQSFDFLNSIGGKPTGRDLSRESLYVKFDPLVQPAANSLIDFSKEGEALPSIDASPPNPHNTSICEQLLAISPQKKPDAIVPPLTPLSSKVKNDSHEEKLEKLKELQNEIYFLKNLYSERERTNKAKMEDYESQITKLTGDSCFLEDKLKESNEREKSLVKKVKEQKQSINQLTVIMEEYVNVISKLTAELEALKIESKKQIESLSMEKESYMTHLQNTEAAFTDVHTKYEKSKKTIASLKANENLYRNTIAEQAQKLEDFKAMAKEAQEKAMMEFQKIQDQLNETKSNHTQESARLRAQLRKTELKVEALQESLDQKIKENQQLTAICDELIEGKK